MNIDDLKIGELKSLLQLLQPQTNASMHEDEMKVIVVLQRGWCAVGRWHQTGDYVSLSEADIVRRWGTTGGLGELADKGPMSETILDAVPQGLRFHILSVVATFPCSDGWSK